MRIERTLVELHRDDPERAIALAFGRRGALAAMGLTLGATIPFGRHLPPGVLPAALAQNALLSMDGKAPLILLGERPLVAETPETLLDDAVTPAERMFIRNNGQIPEAFIGDPRTWRLVLDGAVGTPLELTLGELEARFPIVTLQLQMECGGNGRGAFVPEARGNQWGNGAISNGAWTGVRLRDLIAAAAPREDAQFTGHFGADPHLSGATDRAAISRGMPMAKALDPDTLVALRLNGAPIPHIHGAPVRLLVPGWPGSLSQKWLTRITLLQQPHKGQGMGGTSYRIPVRPIVPGSNNDGAEFADMTSMPVRAILSSHAHGTRLPHGTRAVDLRGAAWAGDLVVRAVHASVDFGATWQAMAVAAPANAHSWQRWTGRVVLPSDGYFEVWYRATDADGRMQPHAAANWNPQGYGGNAIGRAAVLVG